MFDASQVLQVLARRFSNAIIIHAFLNQPMKEFWDKTPAELLEMGEYELVLQAVENLFSKLESDKDVVGCICRVVFNNASQEYGWITAQSDEGFYFIPIETLSSGYTFGRMINANITTSVKIIGKLDLVVRDEARYRELKRTFDLIEDEAWFHDPFYDYIGDL